LKISEIYQGLEIRIGGNIEWRNPPWPDGFLLDSKIIINHEIMKIINRIKKRFFDPTHPKKGAT